MWYRFAKIIFAKKLEEVLQDLELKYQVPQEVIEFVKKAPDNLKQSYIRQLMQNSQKTISELEQTQLGEKKDVYDELNKYLRDMQFEENVNYNLNSGDINELIEIIRKINTLLNVNLAVVRKVKDKNFIILNYGNIKKKFDASNLAEFVSLIHSIEGNIRWANSLKNKSKTPKDLDFKTNTIEVKKCNTRQECILYGSGTPWCVSKPETASHYLDYKIKRESSFYIIYDGFKNNEETPNPASRVLITPGKDNQIEFADERNHPGQIYGYTSYEDYKNYLRRNNVNVDEIKYHPLSDEERNIIKKVENANAETEWFKNLSNEEKVYYINFGHVLTNAQFEVAKSIPSFEGGHFIIDSYVDSGKSLPFDQIKQLKSEYKQTYVNARQRSIKQIKENFDNDERGLVEYAIKSFDRELINSLINEGKFNEEDMIKLAEQIIATNAQEEFSFFNLDETKDLLKKLNWEAIVTKQINNDTFDQNFVAEYNDYISDVMAKFKWNEITALNIRSNTLDTRTLDIYKDYLDWKQITKNRLDSNTLDQNFIDRYRDYLDWDSINEQNN